MEPTIKPTKGKLNHCWAVRVQNPTYVHELLLDFVDTKVDLGYRLRHTVDNGHIIVSQNSMYDVNIALSFLKPYTLGKAKRIW